MLIARRGNVGKRIRDLSVTVEVGPNSGGSLEVCIASKRLSTPLIPKT
jgi:hypothetical protein